ncbi:MAG TPA: helix-turn-helix domain-containing protein [Candidatus Paceibacterota bacterium]
MIDRNLLAALTNVGFDEKEARVYLSLLELGEAPVSQIAKRAEVKRSITYHVLERLKTDGYVQSLVENKVKRFSAVDPLRVLSTHQVAVEELRFMLPLIRALQDKGQKMPRIEFFEGKKAIVSVYRLLEKSSDVRFLTSIQHLNTLIPEEVEGWVRRYESRVRLSKNKVQTTLLPDTPEDRTWAERVVRAGQRVRLMPKQFNMEMDFSVGNDMLAITSFDPLFIVVIHSEQIAHSAAILFDLAWKASKEISSS